MSAKRTTRRANAAFRRQGRATLATPAHTPRGDDGPLILHLLDAVCLGLTWRAWRAALKGFFGLPMTEEEGEVFRKGTARDSLPTAPAREAWIIAGRRSGKSRIAALCVVFLAAIRQWRTVPGERPMVLLIAPSRRQAAVVLSYATAMIELLPGVSVVRSTTDETELSTGVTIRIESASFRTPRGFTVVGVVADEIAFWRDESGANPDVEILRAVRPALASVAGSLLVAISSPYAARGALHDTYERHYGRTDSDTLVWQSDSRTLNPTLAQRLIDQAVEEDPSSAQAEWYGQFRSDLESLFSREALAAVVMRDRYELQPQSGIGYVAFLDPSGGSADSFTLAIAHRDQSGRAVLDLVRETKPPFSPEAVCATYAADIKRYRCRASYSDAYAGEWPREQFSKHGLIVQTSPLTRSELYLQMLPSVNSGTCELLDSPRLLNQLTALERRTGRSGRDAVDHPRGGRDDLANAAAGALVCATRSVGLKAALPSDFAECVNPAAEGRCAFLCTGPWFPQDSHCKAYCPGHKAVWPSYHEHRQQTAESGEPTLTGAQFLRERFDVASSPLTARAAWRQTR